LALPEHDFLQIALSVDFLMGHLSRSVLHVGTVSDCGYQGLLIGFLMVDLEKDTFGLILRLLGWQG